MHKVELKEVGLDIGLAFSKHFYKTDYLHYGYWPDGLTVEPANVFEAQVNYANYLLKNIPEGVSSILDVGCGSGKFAEIMLDAGYSVDCVSPSPNLTKHVRNRLGDRAEIFETRYEDVRTEKRYDMILCSESFQYLLVEEAIEQTKEFFNKQGYLLICDFFKRDVPGKSPISGGHRIERFLEYMDEQPFTKLTDLDITKEAAPSLDIMRDLIQEVIAPTWNIVAYYMRSNYPRFTRMFSFAFRKKIAQAHRKYLSGSTSGEQFAHFKTYRLFLYQQKG
jgi:cyclopropane fatty-acyl-phospholipid synthase-like methyltransferase